MSTYNFAFVVVVTVVGSSHADITTYVVVIGVRGVVYIIRVCVLYVWGVVLNVCCVDVAITVDAGAALYVHGDGVVWVFGVAGGVAIVAVLLCCFAVVALYDGFVMRLLLFMLLSLSLSGRLLLLLLRLWL